MYQDYFNLRTDPFRMSPDSLPCFVHESFQTAQSYMQYATGKKEGILIITGVPGTGKTSLIHHFLDTINDQNLLAITVNGDRVTPKALLSMTLAQLGTTQPDSAVSEQLLLLEKLLMAQHTDGKTICLIIDEAQELNDASLEFVRRLTNHSSARKPLLMVFMLGHEELLHRIQGAGMEQIHQRVVAAWKLEKLDARQTRKYIEHRLLAAGWQQKPSFDSASFNRIHLATDGIPRWINLVCGRLLLHCMVNRLDHLNIEETEGVIEAISREGLLPSSFITSDCSE